MKKRFLLVCFVISFVFSSYSFAEDAPSKGFKIADDTVLNVGISIIPEYESNITKASEDTVTTETKSSEVNGSVSETTTQKNTEIVSDMILHYSPYFRIKLDDSNKTLGLSFVLDYNHYLGLENSKSSSKLSKLDLRSDLLGEFNKSGLVIFDFKNTISRSATPDGQELSGKHQNLLDSFAVGLAFKNVEDILYGKIKLGLDVNYLEESKDNDVYKDYNYVSVLADFFGRWKFLPKTMAFASASIRYQDYYESSLRDASRSIPINTYVGVMGQVTEYFSSKLALGYSVNAGKTVKHDYNANAEIVFKRNDTGALLGYLRTMRPSAYYRYNASHKVYFNFKQKFAKYFLAGVSLNYSYISYGKNISYDEKDDYEKADDGSYQRVVEDSTAKLVYTMVLPKGKRKDHLVVFTPSLSYAVMPWFGLKLSYNLEYKDTDYFQKSTTQYTNKSDSTKNYTREKETHYDYIDHRIMLAIVLDY
jgi:hypothetical protein